MSRFRPVSKFKAYQEQSRSNFSGSHNNGTRQAERLLIRANQVLAALTAAAGTFPSPPVDLVTLQADINNLQQTILTWGVKGNKGSHASKRLKDQAAQIVLNDLSANAAYVQAVANDDTFLTPIDVKISTILLGGYAVKNRGKLSNPMVQNPTAIKPSQILPPPQNLRSPLGKEPVSGQARLRWKKVKGASGYNVYFLVPDTNVVQFITTTTDTMFQENIGAGNSRRYFVTAVGARNVTSGRSQTVVAFGKP